VQFIAQVNIAAQLCVPVVAPFPSLELLLQPTAKNSTGTNILMILMTSPLPASVPKRRIRSRNSAARRFLSIMTAMADATRPRWEGGCSRKTA
jgi:hypothetical protein